MERIQIMDTYTIPCSLENINQPKICLKKTTNTHLAVLSIISYLFATVAGRQFL